MTLRQKIERRILDLYGEITVSELISLKEHEAMIDDIMNEISKEVYGVTMKS